MASSAGSDIFAVFAFLIICLIVLLLLRRYIPLRSTPAFLTTPIFLALALPASAIVLLPIDLASSATTEDETYKGIWLPERVVLVSWRIIYWLTFVLTWLVLPFLADFMDAGHRDPKARMIYSLRSNARYQLIVLSCGAVGLVYVIWSYGFDFTAIKGLIMALAYVWGLILAIYLMGHGLVAVPRRLIRDASISGRLRRIQIHAPRIHEKLEDAIIALEDIELQIEQLKQRKTGTAREFQSWIEELVDTAGQTPNRLTLATSGLNSTGKVPAIVTERYLADLTRRFTRARHQRARYTDEWNRIVQTASDLQIILDSRASKKLTFGRPSSGSSILARSSILTPYLRYHLYVHVIPATRLLVGAVLTLASIAIIQSEIIRFPAPQLSAVSLTVVHHPSSKNYQIGFGGQILAALWITYMVFCALSSISTIPTWNQRSLVRRNTYAESACWYAGQIAKLTVPLAYNFLTFLPVHTHTKTTFYHFLGRLINLTPLGTWFDYIFPIFILIPVCATLFNLYGRIKRVFGFGIIELEDSEESSSPFGTGSWREGRDLIARDLNGHNNASYSNSVNLSLTNSPRTSVDAPRALANHSNATPWIAPSQRPDTNATPSSSTNPRPRPRGPVILDPEPEEENFFTLFGRRVKNTFEGIETPKWMNSSDSSTASNSNLTSGSGFKRPKWMGGDGDDNAESSNLVDRLFGGSRGGDGSGGRGDGRIVL